MPRSELAAKPVSIGAPPPALDLCVHDPHLLEQSGHRLRQMNLPERLAQLRLGSEFCERLIPTSTQLDRLLAVTDGMGIAPALVTPMLGDSSMARVRKLLAALPDGAEVIVNDWGALHVVANEFPDLQPVAGRQMCKQVKDPRLGSPTWARLYPGHAGSTSLVSLLRRFRVNRLEVDVAPFASVEDLQLADMDLGVHADFGFAAKGRVCQMGSMHQPITNKFAPLHGCQFECLSYATPLQRQSAHSHELPTIQWGNAMLYAHNEQMRAVLTRASVRGQIARLVRSTLLL
jgi:hypothetical protein